MKSKKKKKVIFNVIANNKFQCVVKNNSYVIQHAPKEKREFYLVTEFRPKKDVNEDRKDQGVWNEEDWEETGVTWHAVYLKELVDTFEGMMK